MDRTGSGGLNLHCPTSIPHINPVTMTARACEVTASAFDDRIDILDRNAVEAFPSKQVFGTVLRFSTDARKKGLQEYE